MSHYTTGIYRSSVNQLGIYCGGTLRANFGTSAVTFALGLALLTMGETSAPFEYYEEAAFSS